MSCYRYLEHMTDAKIEAFGPNLDGAFECAARALEDTMVDINAIAPKTDELIILRGKDREELLYLWLEKLISNAETKGMFYSDFRCKIRGDKAGYELEAKMAGEKFDPERHEQKTAVKAPTYHEMSIGKDESGRTVLRFLLDL
jgi:SHS2 domain-containing protein